jgi:hypothetical protein
LLVDVLRNLFLLGPISFSSDSKDGEVDGVTEMLFVNADEKVSVLTASGNPFT